MSDKQKADRISVLETIQDWLEPQTKPVGRKLDKHGKKKSRGWGIGLIDDDKRVIGFSFKNKDFNNEPSDKAVIEISEWIPGQMVLKNGFWTCEKKAE